MFIFWKCKHWERFEYFRVVTSLWCSYFGECSTVLMLLGSAILDIRTSVNWHVVLNFLFLLPFTALSPNSSPLITYMKPWWMCISVSTWSWWSYKKKIGTVNSLKVCTHTGAMWYKLGLSSLLWLYKFLFLSLDSSCERKFLQPSEFDSTFIQKVGYCISHR